MAVRGGTREGEGPAPATAGAPAGRPSGFPRFLVAVGLVLGALGARAWWLGHQTTSWPRLEAVMVSSDLTVRTDTSGRSTPSIGVVSSGNRDEFAAYAASFRYVVDGVEYIAHGIERGDFGLQNSALSRDLSFAHPIGSKTVVVVNPRDPADAYLVTGPSSTSRLLLGVGAAFLSIGVWIRWAMSKAAAKRRVRKGVRTDGLADGRKEE